MIFWCLISAGLNLALAQGSNLVGISGNQLLSNGVKQSIDLEFKEGVNFFRLGDYKAAMVSFLDAAQSGNPHAQVNIGVMYRRGLGVASDQNIANKWFSLAMEKYRFGAEQGDAESQFYLGRMYQYRMGVEKNFRTAAKFWLRLDSLEDIGYAQHNLGWLYQQGKGVKKNYHSASQWWSRAADRGKFNALFYNIVLSIVGEGVIGNWILDKLFVHFSAFNGVGFDDSAAYWYYLAADKNMSLAQVYIGSMYEYGRGVPVNYEHAVKWYKLAAEQGDAFGQFNVGLMYETGRGVRTDYKAAAKWYRLASEQEYTIAQYNLAELYDFGLGFPQDSKMAEKWYRRADQGGIEFKKKYREIITEMINPSNEFLSRDGVP